jgi:ketosteroid isomerase-like protein
MKGAQAMISRIARAQYVKGLRAVEAGDIAALLTQFDRRCRLVFVGDSPLGADLSTREDLRRWFERFGRLLPAPHFEIQRVIIAGPPWNQRLAAHVFIRSTVNGEPYRNQFAQFLNIRWGKVVHDLIVEDTQMWKEACDRLVAAGIDEAAQGPLSAQHAVAPVR